MVVAGWCWGKTRRVYMTKPPAPTSPQHQALWKNEINLDREPDDSYSSQNFGPSVWVIGYDKVIMGAMGYNRVWVKTGSKSHRQITRKTLDTVQLGDGLNGVGHLAHHPLCKTIFEVVHHDET
ncbi:hypothetical protein C8J56DRAFT_1032470 [Mycena floridula]|nr:hypothetical protein C8J56DRAFT_1032470 [Mycena floridula]